MARTRINDFEGHERVKAIASALLASVDDMKRKRCPSCGHPGLECHLGPNSVAIICTTPLARSEDHDGGFATCEYSYIVHLTDITTGPFALKFAEEPSTKPAPPAKKPTTRRRTAR